MVNVYLFFQVRKEARSRHTVQINILLCGWWCKERFGFYGNGLCFNDCSLIEKDGIIPYKKGKRIFGSRLVSLVRQALKMKDSDEEVQSGNACAIASSWAVGNFNQCGDGCSLFLLKMRLTGLTTSRVRMVMMNPLKPFSGEAGCLNTFLMCLYIKMHRAWGINSKK